ncbi:MAG: ROK family protein [Spirochaetales bacterium]
MKTGSKPKSLKDNNVRLALEIIRRGEIVSVAGISEEIRLSKTTAKKIIDQLLARGFVVSVGKGESTDEGGKRPELYRFRPAYGYVVSAHITPDSIIVATMDLDAVILDREEYHTGAERDFDFILKKLLGMVISLVGRRGEASGRLVGFAIALPGLVDSQRGVSIFSPHFPIWGRDLPIAELFRKGLVSVLPTSAGLPIYVDCTNRFQAIAERDRGLANGIENFMIIDALEEGLGAGIVLAGKVKHGAQSLSGEVGHLTLDSLNGPECICGNRGCFEALVSAKRMRARARSLLGTIASTVVTSAEACEALTLTQISDGASVGDPLSRELIRDVAHWFVVGLGNVVLVNDPELIIIQGEYVRAGEYFLTLLRDGMNHIGLPAVEKRVRIEASTMDENRGMVGGACLVINEFFSQPVNF